MKQIYNIQPNKGLDKGERYCLDCPKDLVGRSRAKTLRCIDCGDKHRRKQIKDRCARQ